MNTFELLKKTIETLFGEESQLTTSNIQKVNKELSELNSLLKKIKLDGSSYCIADSKMLYIKEDCNFCTEDQNISSPAKTSETFVQESTSCDKLKKGWSDKALECSIHDGGTHYYLSTFSGYDMGGFMESTSSSSYKGYIPNSQLFTPIFFSQKSGYDIRFCAERNRPNLEVKMVEEGNGRGCISSDHDAVTIYITADFNQSFPETGFDYKKLKKQLVERLKQIGSLKSEHIAVVTQYQDKQGNLHGVGDLNSIAFNGKTAKEKGYNSHKVVKEISKTNGAEVRTLKVTTLPNGKELRDIEDVWYPNSKNEYTITGWGNSPDTTNVLLEF